MSKKVREMERFFYRNPSSNIHLRELAEVIGVSPGFVSKRIRQLLERGIVDEEREGNMRIFSANTSSSIYRRSKRAHNIQKILTSDLIPYLEKELYPDALILFGSYLEGRDSENSDIDIAVVNGRREDLDLSSYEERFERRIKLTHVHSRKVEPEFLETLANGLVLSGHLEVIFLPRD